MRSIFCIQIIFFFWHCFEVCSRAKHTYTKKLSSVIEFSSRTKFPKTCFITECPNCVESVDSRAFHINTPLPISDTDDPILIIEPWLSSSVDLSSRGKSVASRHGYIDRSQRSHLQCHFHTVRQGWQN